MMSEKLDGVRAYPQQNKNKNKIKIKIKMKSKIPNKFTNIYSNKN
jgi:hypothetical protein